MWALKFMSDLGDVASASGCIPKDAFLRWAMQLLSVALQKDNANMYRRSRLVLAREQGIRYDPGLGVPVLPD